MHVAATIARTHHERWDGSGYPSGLNGEQIPLEGRIVAVCDVYDALCSERPYKPALADSEVLGIMREGVFTHFDPSVYDAFERSRNEFEAIRARFSDESRERMREVC